MVRTRMAKRDGFAVIMACIVTLSGASGAVLEKKSGERKIEDVSLASEVTFRAESGPVQLMPYASGLLRKKVAFFWAKVYVGQVFAPTGLEVPPKSIAAARSDLSKQSVVAVIMTFVRDVDLKKLRAGFEETLESNNIDPSSAEMLPLFEILSRGGDVEEGEETTIVLERRKNGTEWAHFENGKRVLQTAPLTAGAIPKILTIWFGIPGHSGMESLHREFLGEEKR